MAVLTAAWVARAMGGTVTGPTSASTPGPSHSPADRSLSVLLDPDAPEGFRVNSFAGDDPLACRDHVRDMLGLGPWQPSGGGRLATPVPGSRELAVARFEAERRAAADQRRRFEAAMRLWGETVKPRGTMAEVYLGWRRLALPEIVERGGALRFHPACPFRLQDGGTARLPAMVCLMTDPLTAEPRAIHRTALAQDGRGKASVPGLGDPKKMLGTARGAVIRLCADDEVTLGLGLAEGIENAVAAICGGFTPVWAAGSADGLARFPVLPGVEALTILADAGEAGERAAEACGQRWADAGREVAARFPAVGDWNDMLGRAA